MSTHPYTQLLAPAALGALALSNRIIMAPLTRSRATAAGLPTTLHCDYYRQRASAGLIITEATHISPTAVGYPRTPGIYNDAQVAAWREVTNAVHDAGGRMFMQLWHVGRISHPIMQPAGTLPVAPSAIAAEGEIMTTAGLQSLVTPRALTTAEIPAVVAEFRHAAANAKRAGCDGVEIHAANGYLIDQFLRDGSNQRTDEYGGSLQNRAQFLEEIISAVLLEWPADRVGVRVSPVSPFNSMHDSDPAATFGYVADRLNHYGVAYLHGIQLGNDPFDFVAMRRRFNGAYIANGGYDAARAEAALATGTADFISFGTAFIANPDLVARIRCGAPLSVADQETYYQGEAHGYTDYPTLDTTPTA